MLFNSLTFLLFFAIVWTLYQLPMPWRAKKLLLVVASCVFYAAWNPPFVLLLIASAIIDFHLARRLGRAQSTLARRSILILSLSLSLGVLCYFKYSQFLLSNFTTAMASIGVQYHPPVSSIILPLGISFYTFETISYLADVYRHRIEPTDSLLDYALFLTFFPHLVAGPIVRPYDFLPQCRQPRRATADQLGWGLALLMIGLFEKVILADAIFAPIADRVYGSPAIASFADGWAGTFAFAGQIFFDFAGYSSAGIGVALCLGFVLNDNFRCPYAAVGFSDFWQRWHISLSTWLRDYLYIPLGGNRKGTGRTYGNLMLTMLLGGLWHGASWRFVAWGGLHGCYLVGERGLRRANPNRAGMSRHGIAWLLALLTFLLVCVAWVFFRAPDFASAFRLLRVMFQPSPARAILSRHYVLAVLCLTALMLLSHWFLRESGVEGLVRKMPWWLRGSALSLILISLLLAPGDDRAFIYFQF